MAVDLTKFRVPLGSLVVDLSMVTALIWWGATMTQRLEEMTRRIDGLDGQTIQLQADKRLSVVETRQMDVDRQLTEIKAQQVRIETKIDRLLARD